MSKHLFIGDLLEEEIRKYVQDQTYINKNKNDKNKNRDEFGEVFTPLELIDELLDNIPKHVWTNPNARWLDPAAGIGNFPAIVYCRLMKSLKSKIPNVQERKTHILSKMLFLVELNVANVRHIRKLFGDVNQNIFHGDFLDLGLGLDMNKFDVILGNPPFQVSKKGGKYKGSVGNRTLWNKFIEKAIPMLKENTGILAFLTPANWRRPEAPLYPLMTRENTLLFLHIYGKAAGLDKFGIQSRFDTYVIQRGPEPHEDLKQNPIIIDEKGAIHTNINPRKWPFLPNFAFDKIKKILVPISNQDKEGIPIIFSAGDYDARKLSKRKTAKYQYPVVHNITRKGLGIRYAKDKNPDQMGKDRGKVLLNFNERQYPYNDYRGQYGMSQLTFGIPVDSKKEGDDWIRTIESPEFEEILEATKWGAFQTDHRMWRYFDRDLYQRL